MKYLYYLGGAVLGALILVLSPHGLPTAHAAEQAPRLDSWAPAQFTEHTLGGAYIVIEGQMWPDRQYGLSAYLLDRQTLTQIPLETFSYTPLAERMIVTVPSYVKMPATTRSYDLGLTTINGTRTLAENAILVTVNEPVVTPAPSGGDDEVIVTPPPVIPTPSTDIVRETNAAPVVSGYTQERLWSATSGGLLVITGSGWPMTMHGLTAFLVNPETDLRVNLETISYVPDAGRLVVQTHNYSSGATPGWYDLMVMTQSGERTTVYNAIQYIG